MGPHAVTVSVVSAVLLGALVVFFAVLAFLGYRMQEPVATTTGETVVTTTTLMREPMTSIGGTVGPQILVPEEVVVSSQLDGEYGPENLLDGDPGTAWRDDALHGEGAAIILSFDQPVRLFAVILQGLDDESEFHQSHRIQRFVLNFGGTDGPQEVEVPDSHDPFRIDLGGVTVDRIEISVLSTYPGEAVGSEPAREELAVGEIQILGQQTS
jgi:hypothetical protein